MSQDELVEVVDEKENIIRVVTKKEAHELGLLHKTVISEVVDSQGRWLLIKQSAGRQDPGQFVSPMGGHVTAGETNDQALRREAKEELGLTGNYKFELVGKAIFNREVNGHIENHYFIVYKIFSNEQPILNEESTDYKYFSEEEIKQELKNSPQKFGGGFHFVVKNIFPHLLQ